MTRMSGYDPLSTTSERIALHNHSYHHAPSSAATALGFEIDPSTQPTTYLSSPPRGLTVRRNDTQDRHTPRGVENHGDSDSDSDILVYRDTLEDEPFEKDGRPFRDDEARAEAGLEDGDDDGMGYPIESRRLRPRRKSRKILAALLGILLLAATIGVLAASGYSTPSFSIKRGNKHITMDHIFNGTFSYANAGMDWVKRGAEDGTYFVSSGDRSIIIQTVTNKNETRYLAKHSDILGPDGQPLPYVGYSLSADMKYILFPTDFVKQWRHSYHVNYYVHRISDRTTFPILSPKITASPQSPPLVSHCTWAPVGHSVACVSENDVYVFIGEALAAVPKGADPSSASYSSSLPKAIRVTTDGSETVFNGVPDWVYEEEVFETDTALWWSPDAQMVAYLRADETNVREYKLQYYNPTSDASSVNPYPFELSMRYPKPGTPNPVVSIHTFSLSKYASGSEIGESVAELYWSGQMASDTRVIDEVQWVGDGDLLVKEIDRAARVGNVVLFQNGESHGVVVRRLGADGEEGENGWIDHGQNVKLVKSDNGETSYIDIVPNNGFNHIAYFSPANATEPIWLTSGEWEVTEISKIDDNARIVYFIGASPSIDRHLYSVTLPPSGSTASDADMSLIKLKALTDTNSPGYYGASFSSNAGYYVLSYQGPDVPWFRLKQTNGGDMDELLEGNEGLNQTLSEYLRPIVTRSTIVNDGYELNMLEILPPNLDTSGRKKYPVLIRVYGGPGSQMVSNTFSMDWHSFLACERKYIIVMLDGRGTGFKGRKLRDPVRDDLGHWESEDQMAAAREMVKRKYVDRKRIGIWGWSYGGYMTLKTLEANHGLFTLGMAVAPVTNWRLYDSIYTERYMNTLEANPEGYITSSIVNVTNFANVDLAIAHGSGDDNVHFANTARLVDMLTQQEVRGWRFRMFTDSNHSMDKRNGYHEVYQWLTDFLQEKWGVGGVNHH